MLLFSIGEASLNNICTMKNIPRIFELDYEILVNFANSSLIGVNVNSECLGMTECFLYCKVSSDPLRYLRLFVGDKSTQ